MGYFVPVGNVEMIFLKKVAVYRFFRRSDTENANKMITEQVFSVNTHMGHFSLRGSHMEISPKDINIC